MKKRSKKYRVEHYKPVEVEERREFGYMISESISSEQRGRFRSMLELLGEKGGA